MPLPSPLLRTILAVTCLPALVCLLASSAGAPPLLSALLVGLAAACTAWATLRSSMQTTPAMSSPHTPAIASTHIDPKLRHDIRGIISPAMLAAEQLALYQDPAIEKAANTINDSLDRLTALLKQPKAG